MEPLQIVVSSESASVLDSLPIASYIADREGRIIYASAELKRLLGADATIRLDNLSAAIHLDDRSDAIRAWSVSIGEGSDYRRLHRLRGTSGELRWVLHEARPIRSALEITGWLGTLVDVHQEQAERERLATAAASSADNAHDAETRKRFIANLMDASDDCIKVLDLDARLLSMSPNGKRALAIDDFSTVEGHDWLSFWTGRDREAAAVAFNAARSGGSGRFTGVYQVRGQDKWWDVTASPIIDEAGGIERILVVSRDVTEAHLTRQELEASFARERRIAETFQEASLPRVLPTVDHLHLSAEYRPGDSEATVGGDWYDAFALDDGRIVFTIGDVLGHGLRAAVIMGKLRQAIRAAAFLVPDVNAMLNVADRTVRDHSDETYATALAGIYDPITHEFVFASAGHPGPVVRYDDGSIEEFVSPGLLLGLRPPGIADCVRTTVAPGSCMVFYTDGLSEATRDVFEGIGRIREAISDTSLLTSTNPARAMVEHVLRGQPSADDIALMIARVGFEGETRTSTPT